MLDIYLKQLGFAERETQILLILANHPELPAGEVSAKTELPRSSVYLMLKSLMEQGVVEEAFDEAGTALYHLAGPSAFSAFVERERADFQRKEKAGRHIADLLAPSAFDTISGIPRIRFYSGKRDIERMLNESYSVWRKSIRNVDITWWGFQDHQFVAQYHKWLEMIWKTTPPDEQVRLFSNETEEERKRHLHGRQLRFFSQDSEVTSTIWILGEFVVMINARGKPHYAFQFQDSLFASNLRQVFRNMWDFSQHP